jgi:hypothetical protein
MSILVAVGRILVNAAGELLVDAANRAVSAAQERLRKKPPTEVPPPIGRDKYTAGLFDGIDRERARQLQQRQTELARQQLDERSDEK